MLDVDVARLTQIFGNLLNNAAKYTQQGGIIWITAEREGGEAVVRVRDNGPGIPPHMLDKVFDMFTQVDDTLERSHGGLGIGLTLVKVLTEMQGGSVEARSEGLGRGSEFIVRLPVLPAETRQAEDQPQYGLRKIAALAHHRVLVVDDNEAAASTLGMIVQSIGHEVRLAHDGPAAIAMAREYKPEVIFLDIGMPGMNGYQVAQRLRADAGLAQGDATSMTLVALTGYGQEEDQRRAIEAGFDQHMVKPANIYAIEALLANLPSGEPAIG